MLCVYVVVILLDIKINRDKNMKVYWYSDEIKT